MLDALNKVLKEVFSWILQLIVTVLLNREVVPLKTRRGDERQQAKANNSFTRLCIEDHSVTFTLSKLIVTDVVTENCVAKPRHTYRLQSADCSKSVTLVGHLLCWSAHFSLKLWRSQLEIGQTVDTSVIGFTHAQVQWKDESFSVSVYNCS